MTINFTLAVQIINFFIAYLMLKKLLFKPAVASIKEDDAAIEHAHAQIEDRKKAIAREEQRIKERLQAFKKIFRENEPDVTRALEVAITVVPGMPSLPTIDRQEVESRAQKISDKLIDEVAHVN